MSVPVRVGAVSYLNTRPLVFGMAQGLGAGRVDLSYDVPSVLADRLAREELDVALLPVIELARIPDLAVVPGLAIGSLGACRSVRLLSRVPLDEIRSIALDPESRTSNVLVRVLCAERWGLSPAFVPGPADGEAALSAHDAAVRTGDKALFEPVPAGVVAHDLGAAWTEWTRLPFVFAVWAARLGVLDADLYRLLHASKRAGDQALSAIAEDYTWHGRQYPDVSLPYLRETMRYRFGGPELEAVKAFLAAAARTGCIERVPDIRIAAPTETACR